MANICTGYFAKMKKYELEGFMCVSIAAFPPYWYTGVKSVGLAPDKVLLSDWKDGKITDEEYTKRYLAGIDTDVLESYLKSWDAICEEQGYAGVVLLCFERNGVFCHRHVLADFIEKRYDRCVEELMV